MSVSVCLSVCVCLSYFRNYTSDLHQFFLHVTYGRGSVLLWRRCDYVFPVLWMTSYLHIRYLAARRRRQAEAVRLTRTHPRAWRLGIPVPGSGRSGLLCSQGLLGRSGHIEYL